MAESPPIEVRGLVKRYGEITAVDDVDLTVNPGDVFGYLGPNGAGKTTSLRMMLGLIRPTAGSVRLFGRDPQISVTALEGVAGFVEAPSFYPYLSGLDNLKLCAALDGSTPRGSMRSWRSSSSGIVPRTRSRATPTACASGSGSRRRCSANLACSCSTSRPPGLTRRGCGTCGCSSGTSAGAGSRSCSPAIR